MLHWAITFLVIGLVASLLGFTTVAGASYAIAKIIGVIFLVGFVIFLLLASGARRSLS